MRLYQALFSVLLLFAACDAIGVVGTDSIQTFGSSTTSKTVVAAQTPLAGDVMILGGIFGAATTPTGPSGFTLACSNSTSGGYLWYHVAGAGENPNYGTMTWSGASGGTLFLGERSGMNTSSPFTTGSPCTMATPAGSSLSPSVSLGLPSYSGSVGEGLFETPTLNRCSGGTGTCNQVGWTEQAYRNNTVFGEEQYESATAPPGGTSAQINFNTAAPTIVHALGWYDNPAGQAVTTLRYMLGIDFVCGSGPNGSLTNPGGNITSTMAANALAALYHTNPLIVVNENPWQNQPYSVGNGIECTPPSSLFTGPITYLIRFTTYNPDFLYQSSQTLPTPWLAPFVAVQYDNELNTIPQTNPNENAVPGGDNSVPGWYYWAFPQQLEATYPSDNFQSTAGISQSDSGQLAVLYGTSPYWITNVPGMWDAQSQTGGASLSSWQNVWEPQLAKIMAYNTNLQIFLGVGQVLTGGTEATQGQIDTLLENVPPNFSGVWLNCSAQGSVPNGYDRCAQGIADSAGIVDATPYPIPVTTSPPPSPPPSPAATPTPQPNATSLCIGQVSGTGLVYNLVSDDEFNQDTALNTASPMPSALNISDTYPAASPPAVSTGVQTTWSNRYSFGRENGGLDGTDDSIYPSQAQIATWESEYGSVAYPNPIQLIPGTGVKLLAYPANDGTTTVAGGGYTAGSMTLNVTSIPSTFVSSGGATLVVYGTNGTYNDILRAKISSIAGDVITLQSAMKDNNGTGSSYNIAAGTIVQYVPADVEMALCDDGTCRDNIGGLMDGNINNAYEYGYWVYSAEVPHGGFDSPGIWPSDWTLCETTCSGGSSNNYYEMDTFEVFGNFGPPTGFTAPNYFQSTLQPEGAYGGSYCGVEVFPPGASPAPCAKQYAQGTSGTDLQTNFHTWAEVSTSAQVWMIFNGGTPNSGGIPFAQVPAAQNTNNPGVSPIMVMQTCTWTTNQCGGGFVSPTASPASMIEQYYRHYAQSTTVCGPPFAVAPPASPTPVPTAPPVANPSVAPTLVAQSTTVYNNNSTGFGGNYGVLGTATGHTGSINSTSGYELLAFGTVGGSNPSTPTGWTQLIYDAPTAIYYCVVGSGGGQCPVANNWNFGGDNYGGLFQVYEFAQAGVPIVSSSAISVPIYGTNTTATVPASLTIPSQNGLTLVVSAAMINGATTTTVTSMTDSLTGALTEGTAINLYDVNQMTGTTAGKSNATLRVMSIDQDAYLANAQPIGNTQSEVTNTGNGIGFGNYFVFIPAATATAPPCIPASLLHGMVGC